MDKSLIIKVDYGGLGDHLFHSHLPRIAKASGYSHVYVSNKSDFRNEDYRSLIWKSNPFVDGFCDEDREPLAFDGIAEGMNILDYIMVTMGLDDGIRFHEPEIFYKAAPFPEVVGKSVYDPNYVSYVGDVDVAGVARFLEEENAPDIQLKTRPKHFAIAKSCGVIETKSLTHYCDLIVSCERFYCLTSGGATLAAALGKPATAFYGRGQKKIFHHSKMHRYIQASRGGWRGMLAGLKERILGSK